MVAGVLLYCLLCEGETGAQVYNGANKLEQAMLLFDPAKAMVEARPEIFGRLGVAKRGEKCLYVPSTNSRWRPVSKKPGDGGGASCWAQDEYHEAKTDKLSSTIEDGQGARRQPLAIYITTAGDNIGGPCYQYELGLQKVLEGTVSRETTFGAIWTIDTRPYVDPFGVEQPADDWTSIAAAQKANPNWGVSVMPDHYIAQLEEALQTPSKQASFKTKRLNIWCNAADGFYDMQMWAACADATLRIEDFAGEDSAEGLDLASKLDLCARVSVFRRSIFGPDPETGKPANLDHYYVFCSAYLPSSIANLPQSTDYRSWADQGWLTVTDGDITDYGFILRDLLQAAATQNILEVDFDQRESGFLLQEFAKVEGAVPLFEIPQNTPTLSEPMKWLQSLVVSGRIHHDGNPLLAWAISNVVAKPDHNENVFPRKANDALKIDPHSALLNAMVRARDVLSQPGGQQDVVEVWS
jgi:phage terminase large subunit-like protein